MASASDTYSFPSFPSLWSDDQLESEGLCCSICKELYLKPKLLPCSHTFCEHCLKKLVAEPPDYVPAASTLRPKRFPCPACRQEITVPPKGVAGLNNNMYIADTVERIRVAVMCSGPCTNTNQNSRATHYCHQCSFSLCRECLKAHRNQFSYHRTQSLENVDGPPLSTPGRLSGSSLGYPAPPANYSGPVSQGAKMIETCERHRSEELRFYCENCSIPICWRCRITVHHKHEPAIDIEEASQRAVYELESDRTQLETRIESLSAHRDDLTKKKKHVLGTKKDVETLVKDRAQKLILKIVECREKALLRLTQQSQSLEESFDKIIQETEGELEELIEAHKEVSDCLDGGTDVEKVRVELKMRTSHLNTDFADSSEETRQKRATQVPRSKGFYLDHKGEVDEEISDIVQQLIGKPIQL